MTEHKGEYEVVSMAVAQAVVKLLVMSTKGPAEAYGSLILALKILFDLNTEETGLFTTDDEIIAEFAQSWRSIREVNNASTNH